MVVKKGLDMQQVSFNGNGFFRHAAKVTIGNANPQQFVQLKKVLGEKASLVQNQSGRIDANTVTKNLGIALNATLGDVAKALEAKVSKVGSKIDIAA